MDKKQHVTKVMKMQARKTQLYKDVFGSNAGQEVLLDLMSSHYIMDSTFDEDKEKMIFREGSRSMVLRILKILNTDMKQVYERIQSYEIEAE